MTFCFFSAQYLPTPGGVERYTWNLARRCVAAGHRALVITSALPGLPETETDADGIEIIRLPAFLLMKGRFPALKPSAAHGAAAAAIWAKKPDFCIIQTRMYPASLWAARQCKRRGIPAVVIDHSTGYMLHGGLLGALGALYEKTACGIIKRCGLPFYGVSKDVCRWLHNFGITAAGRLPNAVDPAELSQLATEAPVTDWRKTLHLHDQKLVAFIGRLIPEKGAAQLIQAVQTLPGYAVAVVGTGPELERLRAQNSPQVHCVGALPHREIIQLLHQADCYCLPTAYAEGFPTTLLEAAACHCPIVCTATAGTAELLPGDGYGVILPDNSPAAIAAGLQTLLADPAHAAACAQAAYQNLTAHFTWQAVFDTMVAIAAAAQPGA